MDLALQLRSMLAPVLLAAVPTLATAAPRDVLAPVAGVWTANSATSVLLRGEVQGAEGSITHALRAQLRGSAEGGLFGGALAQVGGGADLLPALEYKLAGAYSRGIDGQLYFSADVLLDLGFLGLPAEVKVGELSGVLQALQVEPASFEASTSLEPIVLPKLDAAPLAAAGYCPGGLYAGVPVPVERGAAPTAGAVLSQRPVARSGLLYATLRFLQ